MAVTGEEIRKVMKVEILTLQRKTLFLKGTREYSEPLWNIAGSGSWMLCVSLHYYVTFLFKLRL